MIFQNNLVSCSIDINDAIVECTITECNKKFYSLPLTDILKECDVHIYIIHIINKTSSDISLDVSILNGIYFREGSVLELTNVRPINPNKIKTKISCLRLEFNPEYDEDFSDLNIHPYHVVLKSDSPWSNHSLDSICCNCFMAHLEGVTGVYQVPELSSPDLKKVFFPDCIVGNTVFVGEEEIVLKSSYSVSAHLFNDGDGEMSELKKVQGYLFRSKQKSAKN